MTVSYSDKESINSSFSEEGEIRKLGSGKLSNFNNNHRRKTKQHKVFFENLDDCIDANYNYECLRSRLESQSNFNKNNKKFESSLHDDLVPITFGE